MGAEQGVRTLWIGTYPPDGPPTATGAGEGIWRVTLEPGTGSLSHARQVAVTPAPSFLAWGRDGALLYAVNEEADGHLSVWRPTAGSLELAGTCSTGGAHPCHVHLDATSGTALVANYTSGSMAVVRLDADGLPTAGEPRQVFEFHGWGPHPGRQRSAHAHYVLPTPAGGHLLVTDLGADVIRRFRTDPERGVTADGVAVRLPPGTGPRHAVFSGDGRRLYVLGELDGRVHTVVWDSGSASGHPVASDPAGPDGSGPGLPAHVVLEHEHLAIGVRGVDRIALHRLDAEGRPSLTGAIELPGSWPRHHAIVDDWLVVAQQRSGGVVALGADGTVAGLAAIPSPACVLPTPGPLGLEEES